MIWILKKELDWHGTVWKTNQNYNKTQYDTPFKDLLETDGELKINKENVIKKEFKSGRIG